MGDSRSRLFKLTILVLCFFVAIVMRVSNFSFVFQNYTGHLNFIDTDCYYYLRRLVHFIANFPYVMEFDPLVDWPVGSTVDWPEGLLLVVGIPLKLLGVSNFRQLEIGTCMIMVVLGVVACAVIVLAAQRLFKNIYFSIFCLFLASTNFLLIRFSCLGQVDHHILEAIFPCLVFYLTDVAFYESNRRFSKRAVAALCVLIPFSFFISSSSVFGVGAFYALYSFVYGNRSNLRQMILITAVSVLLLLPYVFWRHSAFGTWVTVAWPSMFQVTLLLLLGALSSLVILLKQKLLIALLAITGIISAIWFLKFPYVLYDPIQGAIAYVFGKEGVLQNVSEAAPIYRNFETFSFDFMHLNFGYFIWILPAAWLAIFFWKRWEITERAFLLWFSMMTIPAITQKRFSHLMIGGFIIFLAWVSFRLFEARAIWIRKIAPFVCSAFLIGTTLPLFFYGFAPNGGPRDRVDLGSAYLFLQKEKLEQEDVWNRLAGKTPVTEGFWANPNMGHMFLYITGYGAMTNSFYHSNSFDLDFKFRTLTREEELRNELKKNRIRYLLLADDFAFMDLQYRLHKQPEKQLSKNEWNDGKKTTTINMVAASNLAWTRFVVQEWVPTGFERLFSTRFNESHYYTFVRAFKFTEF